jgi:enamine deaminase RidA (YjgF/YER057c/UK114 family)
LACHQDIVSFNKSLLHWLKTSLNMLKKYPLALCFIFSLLILGSCKENTAELPEKSESTSVRTLKRYDRPDAGILRGVEVPEGAAFFFTSGLVGPVIDPEAEPGSGGRYGDTYTQSKGIMERIKSLLEEAGLEMKDIIFLRVYMVPDKNKGGEIDWQGWFDAYAEYFDTEDNPNKVARSTIGIYALANPELLIEIEAVAVYPTE